MDQRRSPLNNEALVKGSFSFLAGAVVGGFLSFSVLEGGADRALPQPALTKVPRPTPVRKGPSAAVKLEDGLSDAELAAQLDEARFDGDWSRATAVAVALRKRNSTGSGQTTAPVRGDRPVVTSRTSLVSLDREHQREVLLRDLAARDNRARREAEAEGSPAEIEQRLTLLFLLPPTQSDDLAVRRDAAFYLARLRTPGARDILIRALGDPDERRAQVAASALGWSDDPAAVAALALRLADDPDPNLRLLAAQGLILAAPDPMAAAALTKAAGSEQEERVRLGALRGLAHCDLASDPKARRAIVDLLVSDTEALALRRAAVATLRAHHVLTRRLPLDLQDELKRLLSTAQGPLLLDAIALLGDVATDPAPLEDTQLKSSNPEVRAAIAQALAALRNRVAPR